MLQSRATLHPTPRYRNSDLYKPGVRQLVTRDPSGVKDMPCIPTKIKLLTETYIFQVNKASFNQNQINPICLPCKKEDETVEHFVLQ